MKLRNNSQNIILGTLLISIVATMSIVSHNVIASTGKLSSTSRTPISMAGHSTGGDSFFNSVVFSLGGYGDTEFGFTGEAKIASYLGRSQQHAMALELDGGADLMRVNTTYGIALTDHQRLKVTYDWLDQKSDFQFPLSKVTRWVDQHAVGAAYQYLFDNPYFEAVEVGGYYSHSPSKLLTGHEQIVDINGEDFDQAEQRRIAGANSFNMYADLALRLWPYSRVSGGIDYDAVRFDTKYNKQHDRNVNGIGGHFQLEQRILPQLRASFRTRLQQSQREYIGTIGWLMPSPAGTQLELEAITDYVDSLVTKRHFYTNGMRLNMAFGETSREYNDLNRDQHMTLLTWTRKPAVRMSEVLAIADGRIVRNEMLSSFVTRHDLNGQNINTQIPEASYFKKCSTDGTTCEIDGVEYTIEQGTFVTADRTRSATAITDEDFNYENNQLIAIMREDTGRVWLEYMDKNGKRLTISTKDSGLKGAEQTEKDWRSASNRTITLASKTVRLQRCDLEESKCGLEFSEIYDKDYLSPNLDVFLNTSKGEGDVEGTITWHVKYDESNKDALNAAQMDGFKDIQIKYINDAGGLKVEVTYITHDDKTLVVTTTEIDKLKSKGYIPTHAVEFAQMQSGWTVTQETADNPDALHDYQCSLKSGTCGFEERQVDFRTTEAPYNNEFVMAPHQLEEGTSQYAKNNNKQTIGYTYKNGWHTDDNSFNSQFNVQSEGIRIDSIVYDPDTTAVTVTYVDHIKNKELVVVKQDSNFQFSQENGWEHSKKGRTFVCTPTGNTTCSIGSSE